MKEKIVLIIPKDNICAEPLIYPPLGLLYVAAVLENDGYDVVVYDMRDTENIIEKCPKSGVYGFTSATSQFNEVKAAVAFLKQRDNNAFIIIGGHFASWRPEDALEYFDTVVVGEAESIIVGIIANRIRGIVDAFESSKMQNVDEIPFPARHLLSKEKIVSKKISGGYRFDDGNFATTVISTRGCPHKCAFCANLPQKVRYRSADNFVAEIKYIIEEYNCRSFKFLDDNFLTKFSHVRDVCNGLKDLGILYRCSARSDVLTEAKCALLKNSGCVEVALGIETANDEILKKMHKLETTETNRSAIKLLKKYQIDTRAYFMVGLPGETKETIEQTKQFIFEMRPEKWIVSIFVPYPGSAVWENPAHYEVEIEEKNWDKFFQLYPAVPLYRTKYCSRDEIAKNHEELIGFLKGLKE